MCGICGFNFQDGQLVQKMAERLKHRGPNQSGFFVDEQVSLGHARLSIIDLSEAGKQPLFNEDKSLCIVFNGEIYNFQELKKLLKQQHHFVSTTDTEVLVHLYEEKGTQMLPLLNGMFSFCIYDKNKNILFGARDRFGKKPFFYHCAGEEFLFASEIKSLLCYKNFSLDELSLQKYLVFGYVPHPHTLLQGVSKLPGGHSFTYDLVEKKMEIQKYWDYSQYTTKPSSEAFYRRLLETKLEKAVQRRLISDVPLGVFLSGGVDSSLVLGLLSKVTNVSTLPTFSIGFREKAFDESAFALQMARKYHTKHHVKMLSSSDCLQALDKIMDKMDEPLSDPSLVPTYLLSEFAKKHVTVVLSGDGADELFGGYPKYFIHEYLHWYDHASPSVQRLFKKCLLLLPTQPHRWLLNYKVSKGVKYIDLPYYERSVMWTSQCDADDVEHLFGHPVDYQGLLSHIHHGHAQWKGKDALNELMYLDIISMFQDMYLTKVDRASMFHSLEVRSPFLDLEVAAAAAEMPSELKVRGMTTKYLLKKVAAQYVPCELLKRKKQGFGIPLQQWVSHDLHEAIVRAVKESSLPHLNKKYALDLLEQSKQGIDLSQKIWNLFVLLKWHKRWME